MNFKLFVIVLLSLIMCSCDISYIPFGSKTTAICRVGERYSNDGKLVSYIEKREKLDSTFIIFGVDGGFKMKYFIYYNYFLIDKDGSEISLPSLDKYADIKRYFEPILPVKNTDYWIMFWNANHNLSDILNTKFYNFDYLIFIVVFDKNGIVYNQYVPEVDYNEANGPASDKKCCGHCFPLLKEYYIEATEDNHIIKFKTQKGYYVYHVDGNILEKNN